jgi:hypothetical protein
MRRAAAAGAVLLALALAGALGACKTHNTKRGFRIGSGCETMDEGCSNTSTANLCADGALREFSCKGPKGCVDEPPADVSCDQSVADEKEPCPKEGAYACSRAKDALLVCKKRAFERSQVCASHVCAVNVKNERAFGGTLTETSTDCR